MKLAIMLAGMASGNRIARDPTQLLAQSARLVQSNPQFSALSDQVRGRLVEAGKGVAVAVVSKQMESLTDRLSERTEQLGGGPDERTGPSRVPRRGRAVGDAPAGDDPDDSAHPAHPDDDPDDAPRVCQPASGHADATGTGASGAGSRPVRSSPRKRAGTSRAADRPGKSAGTARKRGETDPAGGARDA